MHTALRYYRVDRYLALPLVYLLLASALALAAWPLYVLSKRKSGSPAVGWTIAFCFLARIFESYRHRRNCGTSLDRCFERIDARDLKTAGMLMGFSLLAKGSIGIFHKGEE